MIGFGFGVEFGLGFRIGVGIEVLSPLKDLV